MHSLMILLLYGLVRGEKKAFEWSEWEGGRRDVQLLLSNIIQVLISQMKLMEESRCNLYTGKTQIVLNLQLFV